MQLDLCLKIYAGLPASPLRSLSRIRFQAGLSLQAKAMPVKGRG